MSSGSVLFDAPGPKARRRIFITNMIAVILLAAIVALVLWQLGNQGQLAPHRWWNAVNGTAWQHYLVPGLIFTLQSALIALVTSLLFGLIFGFIRLMPFVPLRALATVVVEFFRAVPVLVLMVFFYSFFSLVVAPTGAMDARDAPYFSVITALTLYNGAVIAELVRSGVRSLGKGQREAALTIGMTRGQSLRLVEIPQALVVMLPALMSQFVIILKDSALGYIIGFAELLRYSRQLGAGYGNIMQSIVIAAIIFIMLNFVLTWLTQILSRRLSSRTSGDTTVENPGMAKQTLKDPSRSSRIREDIGIAEDKP